MNFLKYSKLIIIINNNNSKNKNQVTKTGTDPGIFDGGGRPNFGSERTFEIFCGKLLLIETSTRFSICERRSPVAREILLGEHRRKDDRRVPKTITCFEYPWNLV